MGFPKFAPILEVGKNPGDPQILGKTGKGWNSYTQMLNVWPIYLHLGSFGGECRQIYHTSSMWDSTYHPCKSLKNPLINPKPRSCKSDDLLCVFFFSPSAAFGQCKLPPLLYDVIIQRCQSRWGYPQHSMFRFSLLMRILWIHVATGCAGKDFWWFLLQLISW